MDGGEGVTDHPDDDITLTNTQAESLFARVKHDLHTLHHVRRTTTSWAKYTTSPTLSPEPLRDDISEASAQAISNPAEVFHRNPEAAVQAVVFKQEQQKPVAEDWKSSKSDTLIDLTGEPDDVSSDIDGNMNEGMPGKMLDHLSKASPTRKRARSLDHEPSELAHMSLALLRQEPFKPMPNPLKQSLIDHLDIEELLLIDLSSRAAFALDNPVVRIELDIEFFASLSLKAYVASGPLIIQKLSETSQGLANIRQSKRQFYQSFESELQAKDDVLDGNDEAVHKLLASLKAAGGSLVQEQGQKQTPFAQASTASTARIPRKDET